MTNTTTTGLVERSASKIAIIPWKVAEFESESSSPKDIFFLTYLFFFLGGVGGRGIVNLLPLGSSDMQT